MITTGYAERSDFALIPALKRLAPREIDAFFQFDHAALRADGVIPPKVRELIAVAVALTTQCEYCIDVHTGRALGARRQPGGTGRGGCCRRRGARRRMRCCP